MTPWTPGQGWSCWAGGVGEGDSLPSPFALHRLALSPHTEFNGHPDSRVRGGLSSLSMR